MIFNSLPFAIFLPFVFILYWFIFNRNLKLQNIFLLSASYFFYGFWDWRFLFLLFGISLLSYLIALKIEATEERSKRKIYLISGIVIIVGTLAYFKYFNFFIDSFVQFISLLGYEIKSNSLDIILPLGISFYTFLSLSYIIDVYQKKMEPCKELVATLLSLSFFPIILAGPIHRPVSLIPQIQKKREFRYDLATDGLKQILWGVFMKIVIADRCSVIVDDIFRNYEIFTGSTLAIGAIFFAIQLYADFAGYSLIAIGSAKLIGFELMQNFAYPYFSRNITDFWKRWHISLTTWFRDYVFLPISYSVSRKIKADKVWIIKTDYIIYIIGISISWILTGLWHGANYSFIIWGLMNGLMLILYKFMIKPRKKFIKKVAISNNNLYIVIIEWLFTTIVVIISFILFRSSNIEQAIEYISKIFSKSLFTTPYIADIGDSAVTLFLLTIFFFLEWRGRFSMYAIEKVGTKWKKIYRWFFYFFIISLIGNYVQTSANSFIYLKF